jgi:uncharacterized repeat protein (TIGR03943 family)
MSSTQNLGRTPRRRPNLRHFFLPLLDISALAAWGILMLSYWHRGQLSLLIHPNYFGLVVATGFTLLIIASLRVSQLIKEARQRALGNAPTLPVGQHISLLPPGWSSAILLSTAILGLMITPRVFTSQTAIQRGVTETSLLTRSQPQSFRSASDPKERSLIEWVRTLNVYPEPDAYTGQPVKVRGFVVHPPDLPSEYFLISRFVITCCAADAYPVGLPVKLKEDRKTYPIDTWLEIEGQMITQTLKGKRQLTIEASSLKKIPEPANPYYY